MKYLGWVGNFVYVGKMCKLLKLYIYGKIGWYEQVLDAFSSTYDQNICEFFNSFLDSKTQLGFLGSVPCLPPYDRFSPAT